MMLFIVASVAFIAGLFIGFALAVLLQVASTIEPEWTDNE